MKHLIKHFTKLLLALSTIFLLPGCESNLKPENQGNKMETFFENNNNIKLPHLTKQGGLNAGFIRTQETELENNFPKLPNPVLNMFIYPHITKHDNPVPGYTTNFKLYKVDHYALPSEVL